MHMTGEFFFFALLVYLFTTLIFKKISTFGGSPGEGVATSSGKLLRRIGLLCCCFVATSVVVTALAFLARDIVRFALTTEQVLNLLPGIITVQFLWALPSALLLSICIAVSDREHPKILSFFMTGGILAVLVTLVFIQSPFYWSEMSFSLAAQLALGVFPGSSAAASDGVVFYFEPTLIPVENIARALSRSVALCLSSVVVVLAWAALNRVRHRNNE